ncbi:MAG: hypothetical protein ACXWXO_09415 [Nocardioides sp.]
MKTEERLIRALHDEADARDVDVQDLYAATRDRLGASPPVRHRHGWVRPAVAAASVLAVAATGVAGTLMMFDGVSGGEPATEVTKGVDDTFSCPAQKTIRFGPGNDDDSFLPALDRDRQPAGDAVGAPRHEVIDEGGVTLLRLGNADGSLASVSTFRPDGDGWRRIESTVCTNATGNLVPVPGADRLGAHEGLGSTEEQFTAADFPAGSVRVDDRASYDVAGLARRRSIWAEPCGRGVCLTAGAEKTTITTGRVRPDPYRPEDRTSQLADPDDMVGKESAYRLFAVYDRDSELSRVSWDTKDGEITWVQPVEGGGWPGQLFLVLAPADTFGVLTVHPRQGEGRTFTAEQIRD